MSKSTKTEAKAEPKYSAEKILKSKLFAGYQQDFARVILGNGYYTIEEAKILLDEKIGGNK